MIKSSDLHYFIMKGIVDNSYSPNIVEISRHFNTSLDLTKRSLERLQEIHGVVLHSISKEVWIMHPFSTSPTNYCIHNEEQTWWSNCAWCSLGAAALIPSKVKVTSNFGGEKKPFSYTVENGKIECGDWFIHFPIKMANAWDNVVHTCCMMQTFETPDDVHTWCKRHNISVGDIQPYGKMFEFAKEWYGNHLNPGWEKWSLEEAKSIFKKYELHHDIWQIEGSGDKF